MCLQVLALLWLCAEAIARPQHYDTADGLPQQQVIALHQDRAGYLWVGTYSGLGRFNGRDFRIFSTADGLASNSVQAIASSADGQVWVGSTRGLCTLKPGAVRFQCPELPGISTHSVQALTARGANLLVGSARGLYQLEPVADGDSLDPPQVATIISDLNITSLARDDDGSVWVGTPTGLLRWFAVTGQYASVHLPLSSAPVVSALHVEGKRVWIGTSSGLLLLDDSRLAVPEGLPAQAVNMAISGIARDSAGELWVTGNRGLLRGPESELRLYGPQDGLESLVNHSVIRDSEGAIWIGSDGGLSRYQAGSFEGYTRRDGLLADFVRTLDEDTSGRLWLGTREGVQVLPADQGTPKAAAGFVLKAADGLIDERVYDIELPAPGRAWIGTEHGLAEWIEGRGIVRLLTEKDGLPANAVRSLRADGEDRLWIGTMTGIALLQDDVIRPATDPLLSVARVLAIDATPDGSLWFASLHHGLLCMHTDGSVQRLGRDEGFSNEILWDLGVDSKGGLWVGSNGDGLFHRSAEGEVRRYTRDDGMPDNFVWSVLVDAQDRVWAYTSRGLARVDGERIHAYSEADGLLHPEGTATAALRTRGGHLWFGSGHGLVRYVERQRLPDAPPRVLIEQVTAAGARVSPGVPLAAGTRDLSFSFAALRLGHSAQLRYRYRLRGESTDWSMPQAYQPITFAGLSAGSYVFEVQARDGLREWGPPTEFEFEIAPAPWQRGSLRVLGALALLLLAVLAVQLRLRRLAARRQELEALVDYRTQALAEANSQLEQASLTDPLTGLPNRRYLLRQVQADLAQCRRAYRLPAVPGLQRDLLFLLVDIDHFKAVNDRYGHAAGDSVLRQFASLLTLAVRESDYAVRWGGEEFLVVARQADAAQADVLAERIVAAARGHAFRIDSGETLHCTCSVGVAGLPFLPSDPDALEWEQVVDLADAAVYAAKRRGRDGWVVLNAAPGLTSMDLPDLLEAARNRLDAPETARLLGVRASLGRASSAAE
jgi:diguanylate cyclase (GGDEF)-like protein